MTAFAIARASRGVFVSRITYEVAGRDLVIAHVLGQLLYWLDPDEGRATIEQDGRLWLAKELDEWEAECFVSRKQAQRALAWLEAQGLITREYHMRNGLRTTHVALNVETLDSRFTEAMKTCATKRATAQTGAQNGAQRDDRSSPKGTTDQPKKVRPISPKRDDLSLLQRVHPESTSIHTTRARCGSRACSTDDYERFARFWEQYPRKEAKRDALRAWEKLKPDDALTEIIIHAVSRRKISPDWTKDGGRYIPLPATYLRGERWLDEPVQAVPSGRARLEQIREWIKE